MHGVNKDRILNEITKFYLESLDFNGIQFKELIRRVKVSHNEFSDFSTKFIELLTILIELIRERKVGILCSPQSINPCIIELDFEPEREQIKRLLNREMQVSCLYPRPVHLEEVVNRSDYQDKPYTLDLALGSPQLDHRSFDLSILENYRNDPRYTYETNDFVGHICYHSGQMADSDQIVLERFGFSYDSDLNRTVTVCLGYLTRLSPAHQQMWKSKELEGDYYLHPVYREYILGEFGSELQLSIFDAFVAELRLICQTTSRMNRPSLFRACYGEHGENKPKKFSFLVRPTLEEFNNFVLLLDKMISENINKKFFQEEVPYEEDVGRKDGKIEVRSKGTLQILDDWVRKFFRLVDGWQDWEAAIQVFKEVRKKRQKPAHVIDENVFDQKYFKEQRELIIRAYEGMSTLRKLFENHPEVRHLNMDIPNYLHGAKVWKG